MKNLLSDLKSDTFRLSGIIAIIASALVFLITSMYKNNDDSNMLIFCFSFIVTLSYTVALIIRTFSVHRWKLSKSRQEYVVLMLVLWFISAFSLNQEMNIFDNSTNWLSCYICIACSALVLTTVQQQLPVYVRHILSFILGASLILFMYYAIYLIPFYLLSLVAAIFFGLSLHLLIPLFLTILTLVIAIRSVKEIPALKYPFALGVMLPLIICTGFTMKWNQTNKMISQTINHNTLNESKLPTWVLISQQVPKSALTEKIMKAGLVYTIPDRTGNWFWGDFGGTSFDEPKQHDPLVYIASLLTKEQNLYEYDRIRILKSMYDSRHPAQERLWSGENLETASVVSNIKIYPEYRMAYTEKTLSIRNKSHRRWRSEEEAIYTFHLSEGAVVSSLSLWINGVEQKARLTTKGKADTAYKTIVGVESRDPSVIHWQEGNTVSVRVFPCNTEENRKFRIGITSPLKKTGSTLSYENPYFNGPASTHAQETIQLSLSTLSTLSAFSTFSTFSSTRALSSGTPTSLDTEFEFKNNKPLVIDRDYIDKWNLSFQSVPLSNRSFSFNGSSYRLKEASTINAAFKPEKIYLDINSSWSQEELNTIWETIKDQKVYAYTDHLVQVNKDNLEGIYQDLHVLNFSLFPFFEITEPGTALLITKGSDNSPNLSDLENSVFQKNTSAYLARATPLHVYNIGTQLNPYLKTLKEFGVFKYNEGDLNQLALQLQKRSFPLLQEQPSVLTLESAQMAIEKTPGILPNEAPDHLLRLYAYNDILKKVGPTYFNKDYVNDELLKTAGEAYIVSPMSSLIVLETLKDYDRFGIEESKNSLQNASFKSSGEAPEPHEWMLMALTAAILLYYLYQSKHKIKYT
ncbi:XrtN system VIT domain-containing protein [Pedobacter metabolipauper]|uniref:XrtN system VIT domain protein n=1 Tax=Pedobacter metabolipauper TaxID=425513 RepID=A0A4R6STA5_9SPHI|nr:XrtN system VIT domain-containing protein [Pedobacter metabolipauper]TDQ07645.1 XrtN system VIT domain protein [Pedobacter metabolipauper]